MPPPNNITNFQAFLGLAKYHRIYIPKMYNLRTPLKKGSKWIWLKECEAAFQKIKSYLLAHFDPKKEIIVASDASNYVIGNSSQFLEWDYKANSPCVQNPISSTKKL